MIIALRHHKGQGRRGMRIGIFGMTHCSDHRGIAPPCLRDLAVQRERLSVFRRPHSLTHHHEVRSRHMAKELGEIVFVIWVALFCVISYATVGMLMLGAVLWIM